MHHFLETNITVVPRDFHSQGLIDLLSAILYV